MKKQTKIRSKKALVSVVIPVYNAGKYLIPAINSILNQTYKNLEIIFVDDCSTDDSYKILKQYADHDTRIKLLKNQKQRGVSITVKKAIDMATGDYIARMDADDIALPDRISKQVAYLKKNERTVAVGGQCLLIDAKGHIIGKKTFPTQFKHIYKYIFEFVPVQQPTLMIAAHRLPKDFEYYRDGMNTAEEVELFFKLFQYGKVENLSEVVLMYRIHDKNTSFHNIRETFALTLISRINGVYHYGYTPTLRGILITIAQTVIVFLLPTSLTIRLYRAIRALVVSKAPSLLKTNILSPKTLIAK